MKKSRSPFTSRDANDIYQECTPHPGATLVIRELCKTVSWAAWPEIFAAFEDLAREQPGRVKLGKDRHGYDTVRVGS